MARKDPTADFDSQEIILTVPASFDEVARSLTIEAARQAGYRQMTLLEEPQAAFYSWIFRHEKDWQTRLKLGDSVLVCDVGGGTTDFSLIQVEEGSEGRRFQRYAVGRHLLLGGDNLDTALSHVLEAKLRAAGVPELNADQLQQLKEEARVLKEALLEEKDPKRCLQVVLQGTGSSLVGGSVSCSLSAADVQQLLLPGFFGQHAWDEALRTEKTSAIQNMGLPYEAEPSVIKHLACFLQEAKQQMEADFQVDYVLFNGGTMKPAVFQQAVLDNIQNWQGSRPASLTSVSLDLAVSQGAAYFGRARRGLGIKIKAGVPRTYYLRLRTEDGERALTVLQRGREFGSELLCEHPLELLANKPAAFELLYSHVRLHDQEGDLVAVDGEEMESLPPIHTHLRFGKRGEERRLPVRLGIELNEMGILALWLQSQESEHRWSLEFQLQQASGATDAVDQTGLREDEVWTDSMVEPLEEVLRSIYSPPRALKPGALMRTLEEVAGQERQDWSPSLLRKLWAQLVDLAPQRGASLAHEARWWNTAGFLLRPGFGYPADDFRLRALWRIFLEDAAKQSAPELVLQRLICLRRVAGGLNKGQQARLLSQLLPTILSKKGVMKPPPAKGRELYAETVRTLAAMELMDLGQKKKLGKALVQQILEGEAGKAEPWALARLGARQLLYGGVGQVLEAECAADWLVHLSDCPKLRDEDFAFIYQQFSRLVDQRELNLSARQCQEIVEKAAGRAAGDWVERPSVGQALTQGEKERMYGDQLPLGLTLIHQP
jgi:hypothetical protein